VACLSRGLGRTLHVVNIEELARLPDGEEILELRAGLLVAEPLPGFRHGRIAAAMAELLRAHVREHRLGVVLGNDTAFLLSRSPDTVRGPDVAFVAKERFERVGDVVGAFPGAPDLAVEVVSPAGAASDLRAKVEDYFAAGTRLVWLVDPADGTVTVHRAPSTPRVLSANDILDGQDVVPGFAIRVSEIFEI
jgi:Uma2 family endonuclease